MPDPFIMVAPNGARRGKKDHPALPVPTSEIVSTAQACRRAGANALHLHIRDKSGAHSLDAGQYLETLSELGRAVPELRIQITTEAVGKFDVDAQLFCLKQVRPEWASIAVRETARDTDLAPQIYAQCAQQGTQVQHILYDSDDIALLRHWQSSGVVAPGQSSVLFVLGRYSAQQTSTPADLDSFLNAMPDAKDWMVCAFGPDEHACLACAAAKGGQLRVGFENSLTDTNQCLHSDNAASVTALRTLIERQSL